MHVRTTSVRTKKKKIPLFKNAEFLLRGWTQTKILFRRMEKIFRLKHDRDANSPSNAGAAGIKPVILHLSGIWWLLVQQRGQTGEWKRDLCHRNHLYAFKYKHIGSSVIVRLLHLKAVKRRCSEWKLHLWPWMSSCRRSHHVCFCLGYSEQKVGTFSDRFCSSEGKTWRTFPPFLVARGCTTDSCTNIQYDLFMYECNAQ